MNKDYRLRLDLRVLDHLGLKLYSNAAAVLSEAVANAWDADAKLVTLAINNDRIVIEDTGVGMTKSDINDRFLSVGYDKRTVEGDRSPNKRPFMGRKGIGKLALFSIAESIAVHTRKGDEKNAFVMKTSEIKEAVKASKDYYPQPIPFEGPETGTRIVLEGLTKKRTSATIPALRKRIARRFAVIGYSGADGDSFNVRINDKLVGPEDRDDLKAIEFLWEFGDRAALPAASTPSLKSRFLLGAKVNEQHPDWSVRGWLGAAAEPKLLKHDEAGSMNGIVVIARGRLIQENLLDRLGFNRILNNYLTGQVEADFLDLEGEDDIATSDRQRLIEDDDRYIGLVAFLKDSLLKIQDRWTDLRNEARGKEALAEVPVLAQWVDSVLESQRPAARRLLGLIRGIELEDEDERKDLYRSGLLAFERLRLREEAHRLSDGEALTAEVLLPLLSDLAALEGSLYREVIKVRLDVIKEFENLVDGDQKEKVLQQHLFKHLWLLDPGWERATGSERIEQRLKKEYREFAEGLTDEESKGRVDIRYRTNAGQHIIVELKRAGRRMRVSELLDQGLLYAKALRQILTAQGESNPSVAVVFVVGQPVIEEANPDGPRLVRETLAPFGGRVVQYEELIFRARQAYAEYLEKSAKVDRIDQLLEGLK